jgi:hypothetical protein
MRRRVKGGKLLVLLAVMLIVGAAHLCGCGYVRIGSAAPDPSAPTDFPPVQP